MRILLRLIFLTLLAVAAIFFGFVVAAMVAVAGTILFLTRRLRRSPALPRRQRPPATTDAIEITATEVPADRLK